MIKLTMAYDGTPILVNVACIANVRMANTAGQSLVNFINGRSARVAVPFGEIQKMIEEANA